jgi:hypothetical protein
VGTDAARLDRGRAGPDRQVAGQLHFVDEIALDQMALVAERNIEIVKAIGRIVFHDVPEDRTISDLHHRLGLGVGLLGQPRSATAGEKRHFGFELHDP